MRKKDLILVGGGGHCKACIDVIEAEGIFKIAGIVDVKEKIGSKIMGYEIIATDADLSSLARKYKYFLITIGSIKDAQKRIERFEMLKKLGATFPVITSPLAHVAKSAAVEEGTIIMHQALINSDARVGRNCIINTKALIEHDTTIGDHCHISTASVINGVCSVGARVFTGSNSVIAHNVDIANDVIIGAGSVVVNSINLAGIYVGNPAHMSVKSSLSIEKVIV